MTEGRQEPGVRVSTLELFFDLVFVFTATQLTAALADRLDATGAVRTVLMFGVIWWMYGGYAWLTNSVAADSSLRRFLLLTGMAGYLVVALAIPDAFGANGWAFGAGYFVVNVVHSGLFWHAGGRPLRHALTGLVWLNLCSASLVLAGGLATGPWRYGLWTAAFVLQVATPYLHRLDGFSISAAHFVERHGLVVIVALGESIIAIGVGVRGRALDAGLLSVAVLGLVLAYFLWWIYFGLDEDQHSEHALAHVPPGRRPRAAILFGYAHLPMLLGVITLAAGIKKATEYPFEPMKLSYAIAIGLGTALFFFGHAMLRYVLQLGTQGLRLLVSAGALATIPVGLIMGALQIGAVVLVIFLLFVVDRLRNLHSSGTAG